MQNRHFTFFKANTSSYIAPQAQLAHLYIISGPSGVGKTTLINRLLQDIPHLEKIVAYTTRPMRPTEISDQSYHYITPEMFQLKLQHGDFIEHLNFSGNDYGFGLTKEEVLSKLHSGIDLIVDMDYSQILDLKSKIPNCYAIFILPKNITELKERLTARSETPETIERRMAYAQNIIDHANICDINIVNSDGKFEEVVDSIKAIIYSHREGSVLDRGVNLSC